MEGGRSMRYEEKAKRMENESDRYGGVETVDGDGSEMGLVTTKMVKNRRSVSVLVSLQG